tara:strand:+ start:183 stop:389 length:207 start_codon:yes stop_codon:yes gene_type:complete
MSGENLTIDKPVILKKQKTFTTKTYQKVDINNLFAKLKKEEKSKKKENLILLTLVISVIGISGVIASL